MESNKWKNKGEVMIPYELPGTEQALHDFIRYAKAEIKRNEFTIKKLHASIQEAHNQLTIKEVDHAKYEQVV